MVKRDLRDIERISDYSIALMEEIMSDIKKLSEYSSNKIAHSGLEDINNKIDLARSKGVNVDALDKQVLDFRVVLFKRDIRNKIEEVNLEVNNFSFDISKIEEQYNVIKQEEGIDLGELQLLMHELYNEVLRAKIKFMLNDFINSGGASIYTMDQIAEQISIAKDRGVDVSDIEDMLFE